MALVLVWLVAGIVWRRLSRRFPPDEANLRSLSTVSARGLPMMTPVLALIVTVASIMAVAMIVTVAPIVTVAVIVTVASIVAIASIVAVTELGSGSEGGDRSWAVLVAPRAEGGVRVGRDRSRLATSDDNFWTSVPAHFVHVRPPRLQSPWWRSLGAVRGGVVA